MVQLLSWECVTFQRKGSYQKSGDKHSVSKQLYRLQLLRKVVGLICIGGDVQHCQEDAGPIESGHHCMEEVGLQGVREVGSICLLNHMDWATSGSQGAGGFFAY